jgi:hypothetical protein
VTSKLAQPSITLDTSGEDAVAQEVTDMAKSAPKGDGHRIGAVKGRAQFKTPSGHWAKRDKQTGQLMDIKSDGTPFKGVRREN